MILKYSCFIIGVLMLGISVKAQESGMGAVKLSHYVFETFSKGKVHKKNGFSSEEILNYNALTGEMVFQSAGRNLAIAHPEEVDTVYILDRVFIPVENKFYELLTHSPYPLFLEYNCTVKEQGADLGYGMTSKASSTAPLKTLIQSGGAYDLKLPDGFEVKEMKNFLVLKDGKYQKANNAQQLSRIFPDKKSVITEIVKNNKTDFSNREDVASLVNQIQQ